MELRHKEFRLIGSQDEIHSSCRNTQAFQKSRAISIVMASNAVIKALLAGLCGSCHWQSVFGRSLCNNKWDNCIRISLFTELGQNTKPFFKCIQQLYSELHIWNTNFGRAEP
ncbi:hypothetical protein I7I53_03129 [Histoplasma capsulatum var. duboisii H88]|uniref:Uncharacterized protein n=1 Tax=Ajellomyces capsulatus (strain H88) TaxID=544711 RepID=A0A8A1LTI9_AJEC8|nr:hypothetical protein I7I53_03129 [Histoplasma capsulatum var. duboisii H88]